MRSMVSVADTGIYRPRTTRLELLCQGFNTVFGSVNTSSLSGETRQC